MIYGVGDFTLDFDVAGAGVVGVQGVGDFTLEFTVEGEGAGAIQSDGDFTIGFEMDGVGSGVLQSDGDFTLEFVPDGIGSNPLLVDGDFTLEFVPDGDVLTGVVGPAHFTVGFTADGAGVVGRTGSGTFSVELSPLGFGLIENPMSGTFELDFTVSGEGHVEYEPVYAFGGDSPIVTWSGAFQVEVYVSAPIPTGYSLRVTREIVDNDVYLADTAVLDSFNQETSTKYRFHDTLTQEELDVIPETGADLVYTALVSQGEDTLGAALNTYVIYAYYYPVTAPVAQCLAIEYWLVHPSNDDLFAFRPDYSLEANLFTPWAPVYTSSFNSREGFISSSLLTADNTFFPEQATYIFAKVLTTRRVLTGELVSWEDSYDKTPPTIETTGDFSVAPTFIADVAVDSNLWTLTHNVSPDPLSEGVIKFSTTYYTAFSAALWPSEFEISSQITIKKDPYSMQMLYSIVENVP